MSSILVLFGYRKLAVVPSVFLHCPSSSTFGRSLSGYRCAVNMGKHGCNSPFGISTKVSDGDTFSFGELTLPGTQVFARSNLSYAFVNIRPFLPGHSLVSPLRVVKRYRDMNAEELSDFSTLVQITAAALELKYGASASTIVIQDGEASGQTIPHVHAHIIPRLENDLKNPDSIYDELEKPTNRLWTSDEMAVAAQETRPFIERILTEQQLGCFTV